MHALIHQTILRWPIITGRASDTKLKAAGLALHGISKCGAVRAIQRAVKKGIFV
jgi:hypothetical protein